MKTRGKKKIICSFICPDHGSHSFEGWCPSQHWQHQPGH